MKLLSHLFDNNQSWARTIEAENPGFFQRLAKQQAPEYLWIGCSDSRVPANEIVGLLPGELFVHRNVANLVMHTDFNCLSVLQFAIDVLKVKHIIVCGHYGCGGVKAALDHQKHGLIDNWLQDIKEIYRRHEAEFTGLTDETARLDRLCELNVVEQVNHVCYTTIVQDAWARGQTLSVHGWIYSIDDGLLRDLDVCVTGKDQIHPLYRIR
ncbi:carbonate dehydratase [Thiohalobacter sp. IOR34]|uniref:carbonate dehydratase n=1 Tax=Thiohalobacter sp. IOR34 TaxID=3057176 RepID=UPI0025B0CADF|nr:carbonate dehydratase [Thiohalobacter sp. IOR34]WJW76026.1 carbonate dehydratase [Thiohalobacter sp. IOR34]